MRDQLMKGPLMEIAIAILALPAAALLVRLLKGNDELNRLLKPTQNQVSVPDNHKN